MRYLNFFMAETATKKCLTRSIRRNLIEGENGYGIYKGIDHPVQLPGTLGLSTETQLGQSDRADADFRWPVLQ